MACWSINDHWCDILKNAQRQMIYDKCGLSFAFNFFYQVNVITMVFVNDYFKNKWKCKRNLSNLNKKNVNVIRQSN